MANAKAAAVCTQEKRPYRLCFLMDINGEEAYSLLNKLLLFILHIFIILQIDNVQNTLLNN